MSSPRIYAALIFFCSPFFLLQSTLLGQDGWSALNQDNHTLAYRLFEERLAADSLDKSALQGMLLLTDIRGNMIPHGEYLARYTTTYWDEPAFRVFASGTAAEEIFQSLGIYQDVYAALGIHWLDSLLWEIDRSPMSTSAKIEARVALAEAAQLHCRYEESDRLLRTLGTENHWSVIGPFVSNKAQWDQVHYDIETAPYSPDAVYRDETGTELRWKKNLPRTPFEPLSIPTSSSAGLIHVYANTFLVLPESRVVQLRVKRNTAMEIRVDDALVFSSTQPTCACNDGEIIELPLTAGIHRVLVKTTPKVPKGFGKNPYERALPLTSAPNGCIVNASEFSIRFTDTNGVSLPDATLAQQASYKPQSHSASLLHSILIDTLRSRVELDSQDMFSWYLLAKAYIVQGRFADGENYFQRAIQDGRNNVVMRWLLAQLYSWTGKREKIYELFTEVDHQQTPLFGLLWEKWNKIDKKTHRDDYFKALEQLYHIAPGHTKVVQKYLRYYEDMDSTHSRDLLIDEITAFSPFYSWLKSERSDYIPPPVEEVPERPNRLRSLEVMKNIDAFIDQIEWFRAKNRSSFSYSITEIELLLDLLDGGGLTRERMDSLFTEYVSACQKNGIQFNVLIKYYSAMESVDTVLQLYDIALGINPKMRVENIFEDRAEFLLDNAMFAEAIPAFQELVNFNVDPNDPVKLYQNLGHAYLGVGDTAAAVENYRQAVAIDEFGRTRDEISWYNDATQEWVEGPSLVDMIDKLTGKSSVLPFSRNTINTLLPRDQWQQHANGNGALVLDEVYNAAIDPVRWQVQVWRKRAIGIINKDGVAQWTERDLSELGELQSVKVRKASGGEMSPEEQSGVVVFKALEVGDIIEVEGFKEWSYRYHEPPGELSYYFSLAIDAPVYRANVEILVPTGQHLGHRVHNLPENLKRVQKGEYDSWQGEFNSLDQDIVEEAMLHRSDVYRTLAFSTIQSWEPVVDWFLSEAYDGDYTRFQAGEGVHRVLDSLITDDMSTVQKVESIYNFITHTINYSNVPFLQYGHTPQPPERTLSSCTGDCKDMATLMISMLHELEVEACLTLVQTNGKDYRKPLPGNWFNHAIVAANVDGQWMYLDPTSSYHPYYTLPAMDAGAWALRAQVGESDIFQLPFDQLSPEKNRIEYSVEATLDTTQSMRIHAEGIYQGMEGGEWRRKLGEWSPQETEATMLERMNHIDCANLQLIDYSFKNKSDRDKPLHVSSQFVATGIGDRIGNIITFQIPFVRRLEQFSTLRTPSRRYRLDISSLCDVAPTRQRIRLHFPKPYTFVEIPEDTRVESKFGKYSLTFTEVEGGLVVERYQEFYVDRVLPEDFAAFQDFYAQMLGVDHTRLGIVPTP